MKIFGWVIGKVKEEISDISTIGDNLKHTIANGLLKVRGNESVDKAEVVIAEAVMTALEAYTGKTIPSNVKAEVDKQVVNGCNVANIEIVQVLQK